MHRPERSQRPFFEPSWFKPWIAAAFSFCVGCTPARPAVPPLPTPTASEVADILVGGEPGVGDQVSLPRSIPPTSIPRVLDLLPTAIRDQAEVKAAWPWWGTLTIVLNAGGTIELPFYCDDQQNVVLKDSATGEYYRTTMPLNQLRRLIGSPQISNLGGP